MTTVLAFLACLAAFLCIGAASLRERRATTEDYLIAGRSVSGWLSALSSAATNNSGFMFVGLLGFTYRFGVQAIWLQAGWIAGDLLAWLWVHRAVREHSGRLDLVSVPQLLAVDERGVSFAGLRAAAGLLTLVFLGGYAAAQLKAGSTALTGLFGWHESVGIVLGGVIVLVYCLSGGLRASIWTDAAQALVMILSLWGLLIYAAYKIGGPAELAAALTRADPALVRFIPDDKKFGVAAYAAGFVFGGLGVIGQPHILVRTMAMRSVEHIRQARRVYFAWYIPFSVAAVAVGLYARVLLPDLLNGVAPADAASAAERALPVLASSLLPEVWLGILLAGVFAATMSTADSQILACSAALTQDIVPAKSDSYWASKLATLVIATLSMSFALYAEQSVFGLVLDAWSALGAALGPILLVRLLAWPLPERRAFAMMAAGLIAVFGWKQLGLSEHVFELLPGFLAPFAVYALASGFARRAAAARRA